MKITQNLPNFFALVSKIGFSEYTIKQISAEDLKKLYNYRKDSLTIDDVKGELLKALSVIENKRKSKSKFRPIKPQSPGKYIQLIEIKKQRVKDFWDTLEKAKCIFNYKKYSSEKFRFPAYIEKFKYGILINMDYDEEKDWNYYARSYRFPKVTISNRRIEFITLGKDGEKYIIYTYECEAFRGKFMEKAVESFLRKHCQIVSKGFSYIEFYRTALDFNIV